MKLIRHSSDNHFRPVAALTTVLALVLLLVSPAASQDVLQDFEEVGNPQEKTLEIPVGQSILLTLSDRILRIAVANDNVIDYRQTGLNELYLLGRQPGKTDLTIWYVSGTVETIKAEAILDPLPLTQLIGAVSDQGPNVQVMVSGSSFVLQGQVTDIASVDIILRVAEAYANNLSRQLENLESGGNGGSSNDSNQSGSNSGQSQEEVALLALVNQTAEPGSNRVLARSGTVQVINALSVGDSQQVMLEVRIAEVSRSLAEQMGVSIGGNNATGNTTWSVGSTFLGNGAGTASLAIAGNNSSFAIDLDAERKAGRVKILAEPTIAAMSGTEGSFLVGGSVFIPTPSSNAVDGSGLSVTLEEREFGVSLTYRPTVLANRKINLYISSEVSELSREGVSFQSGQSAAILPTLTKSKVDTTVQLLEGQSLVIGGLLKNNTTETKKYVPILGDIPILGALFRSKDYVSDQTELIVVVRPVFAEATDDSPELPTDRVHTFTPIDDAIADDSRISSGFTEANEDGGENAGVQ